MSAMVSPGAETQSGRNPWSLKAMAARLYPQYLDARDPRPVKLIIVGHGIVAVIGREHKLVTGAQINNHAFAVWAVEYPRPTSNEILNGGGSTHVRQSVLQNLGHRRTQFKGCLGLALTDRAQRP